jgi:chromosome segregation ATPase
MLDNAGGEFSKLQELNKDELEIIAKAKRELKRAEDSFSDAEGMSNSWNILFGYKNSKVKSTKVEMDKEVVELKQAEVDANKSYRNRLRNADLKESLQRIISQVQGMTGIIEDMVEDTDVQIQALKNRKELSFGTKEKAAEVMKARKSDLETLEETLKREEISLTELQNDSPEYTAQEKKIADLREQRAELKGKYNIALGIFQSKERFVEQIVVHLEAQTVTKNNLKQLIGQLKSDTEERITTYESGLHIGTSCHCTRSCFYL